MYSVKYSTTTPTGSLRRGNAVMNITQDNDGPTSTTGFYNGIAVPDSGYLVILTNSGASPAYWPCVGDTQLINLARNRFGQTSISQIRDAIEYFYNRTDTFIINYVPSEIVTDSLELYLDPKILSSYPSTGTSVLDLSGESASGRLNNGILFDANTSTFDLDGSDDYIDGPLISPPVAPFTLEIVGKFAQVPNRTNYEYFGAVGNSNGNYTMASISKIGTQYSDPNFHGNLYCYVGTNDLSGTDLPVTGSEYYHVTVEALEEPPFIRIWRNNVEGNFVTGEIPSQPISGVTDRFWIGTWSNSTWWLDGNIGSFKYYTKALSESERLQNYFGGKIVTDGLVFAVDPSNLVSYENGSVNAYSLTGSNIGVLANGTGHLPDNGGVWEFDGTNDQIIGTPSGVTWFTNTSFSVEAWVKPDINPPQFQVYFDGVGPVGGNNKNLHLRIYDYGALRMGFFGDDLNTPSGIINFGEWNHIIMQYNFLTDTSEIYHNGVKVASGNQGPFNDTSATFHIGYWASSSTQYFKGNIGCTRVYSKVLTETEIKQNFEAQKSKFGF